MIKKIKKLADTLEQMGLLNSSNSVRRIKIAYDATDIERTYTIKPGDDFGKITVSIMGEYDAAYLKKLKEVNPGVNSSNLQVGQVINLPTKPYRPNLNLRASPNIERFIQSYEAGSRANDIDQLCRPYDDGSGNITIGYGHKYEKGEEIPRWVYLPELEVMFMNDLRVASNFIGRNVTKVPLNQGQFDVLTSLAFNMGGDGLFNNTNIIQLIEDGISKNLSKIVQAIKTSALGANGRPRPNQEGLVTRRAEEARMFEEASR